MRTAHLCCGLGGSLWTGAILGWKSVYALDSDPWRVRRLQEQARAGWWPNLRVDCATLPDGLPSSLDGGVDLLAAGFSCRDISSAGKGAGLHGASTGPTYAGCLRAIDAWRPQWVFFENSPNIRTKGRSQVTADLVARGYCWRDGVIAAADVGAKHERSRWFLLAHLDQAGRTEPIRIPAAPSKTDIRPTLGVDCGAGVKGGRKTDPWAPIESRVVRVPYDVAARRDLVNRIQSLGDAWVPLQAAAAWKILGGPTRIPGGPA